MRGTGLFLRRAAQAPRKRSRRHRPHLDKDRGERTLPVIGGAAEDALGRLAPCCLQPLLNYCVSLDKVGKKNSLGKARRTVHACAEPSIAFPTSWVLLLHRQILWLECCSPSLNLLHCHFIRSSSPPGSAQ